MTLEEHLEVCRECRENELCREGARLATRERLEREAQANFEHYADSEEI